ncbi:Lysophospholipid acyltransferase [hydrothermal vent metagenome]|uniref:Lysophospholipid acyltransferase n=1 Tax=hydrothermal vent metagenome TaxID=652676 RepID=A0A3B0XQ98_9ZZZZ
MAKHWSDISERGNAAALRFMLIIFKLLGYRVCSFIVSFIVLYFFMTNSKSRHASLKYLKKVYNTKQSTLKSPPNLWTSYKHCLNFGLSSIDKVSSWVGNIKRESVDFKDSQILIDHAKNKQGAVIISAHLGNIELSRALAEGINEVTMNALVFTQNAEIFNNTLKKINPEHNTHLIHVNNMGPETSIMLKDKVDNGEMVVIMGDRTAISSGNRNCEVNFLGEPALFSQGPIILASLMKCPVYLMLCIKERGQYRIHLERISDKIVLSRQSRQQDIKKYIQLYASRLEYYCQQNPLQWFNFFDFWQKK